MNHKQWGVVAAVLVAIAGLTVLSGCAEEPSLETPEPQQTAQQQAPAPQEVEATVASMTEQETCPVMGGPINKAIFVEHEGQKVYFCCKGCEDKFEANPAQYVAKLPQFQQP